MKFIKLTLRTGEILYLNVNRIESVVRFKFEDFTKIFIGGDDCFNIQESPEYVIEEVNKING